MVKKNRMSAVVPHPPLHMRANAIGAFTRKSNKTGLATPAYYYSCAIALARDARCVKVLREMNIVWNLKHFLQKTTCRSNDQPKPWRVPD